MKRMRELWVTNSLLSPILRRYGVHAEGLEDYFWLLCINGAGQWVGGYYVAVASLCFPIPLEYLLKNQDKRPVKDVVFKMIQYFEQGNPYLPIY